MYVILLFYSISLMEVFVIVWVVIVDVVLFNNKYKGFRDYKTDCC